MHIVLAWEINTQGEQSTKINKDLLAVLSPYSWVRPLPSFFIIKINSVETRKDITDKLVKTIQKYNEKIHLVVSPPMTGGSYNGWLPKGLWKQIGERVN